MECWLRYGKAEVPFELPYECDTRHAEMPRFDAVEEQSLEGLMGAVEGLQLAQGESVSILIDAQAVGEGFQKLLGSLMDVLNGKLRGHPGIDLLVPSWRYEKRYVDISACTSIAEAYGLRLRFFERHEASLEWMEGQKSGMRFLQPYIGSGTKIVLAPTEFHGAYKIIDCRHTVLIGASNPESNPKHARSINQAWRYASVAHPDLCVQTLYSAEGKLLRVSAGKPDDAVKEAHSILMDAFKIMIDGKADILIASCGGYPRDATLMNALQCLGNVGPSLKDDGLAILVAECQDGLGGPRFCSELWRYSKEGDDYRPSGFLNHEAMVVWSLKRFSKRFRLVVVSTLPRVYVERFLGARAYDTVSEAVSYALRLKGKEGRVLIVQDASRTLVTTSEDTEGDEGKAEDTDDGKHH